MTKGTSTYNCSLKNIKKGEHKMKDNLIKDIIQEMLPFLNNAQGEKLRDVLQYTFAKYEINGNVTEDKEVEQNFVELFLSAKRIEGCSEKSLKYYQLLLRF